MPQFHLSVKWEVFHSSRLLQSSLYMSLIVVGSVAYDGVETPHGKVDRMLGGAATYISLAASYFTPVKIVGGMK